MSIQDELEAIVSQELKPIQESLADLSEKIDQIELKEGPVGPQGEKGEQGEKGDKGDRGERGLKGDTGDRGDTGVSGESGKDGKDGQSAIGIAGKDAQITDELIEQIVNKVTEKIPRPKGTYFGASPRTWIDETPVGAINGTNTAFGVSTHIFPGSEIVRVGGAVQELTEDYTIADRTITFVVAPVSGTRVRVKYQKL